MTIELIVLDFDGTIIDTEWPHFTAVRGAFAEVGAELTIEAWQGRIGRADNRPWVDELAGLASAPFDPDELAERWRAKKNADTLAEPIRAGVVELVERAEAADRLVTVASSSPRSWVESHLDRIGLLASMATIVTRDDVTRGKPWPDLFALACANVDINPANAVAVEDSHHGCVSAKDAGLACAVVPNRVTAAQDFSRADLVARSVADIPHSFFGL